MRDYGQIQCSFWVSAAEEGWSSNAKLLGAYLLTGPHSNGIGCYRLPDAYVQDDIGWPSETVSETFRELFANGFCNRFGQVVFVPKFLRWNGVANGNVAKARFREWELLPSGPAKIATASALLTFCGYLRDAEKRILTEVSNRSPNGLETVSDEGLKPNGKQKPNLTYPNQTVSLSEESISKAASGSKGGW